MNFKEKFFNRFISQSLRGATLNAEGRTCGKDNSNIIIESYYGLIEEKKQELQILKQKCKDNGLTLYEIFTKYGEYHSQGLPDIDNNFISFVNPDNDKHRMIATKEVIYIKEI